MRARCPRRGTPFPDPCALGEHERRARVLPIAHPVFKHRGCGRPARLPALLLRDSGRDRGKFGLELRLDAREDRIPDGGIRQRCHERDHLLQDALRSCRELRQISDEFVALMDQLLARTTAGRRANGVLAE